MRSGAAGSSRSDDRDGPGPEGRDGLCSGAGAEPRLAAALSTPIN